MARDLIIQSYTAGGVIAPYRMVKFGTEDGQVVQAAANSDLIIGVSTRLGADAAGDQVEVVRLGPAQVDCGGSIPRGSLVTSDANGKAAVAGVNNRVGGVIETTGAAGQRAVCMVLAGIW